MKMWGRRKKNEKRKLEDVGKNRSKGIEGMERIRKSWSLEKGKKRLEKRDGKKRGKY